MPLVDTAIASHSAVPHPTRDQHHETGQGATGCSPATARPCGIAADEPVPPFARKRPQRGANNPRLRTYKEAVSTTVAAKDRSSEANIFIVYSLFVLILFCFLISVNPGACWAFHGVRFCSFGRLAAAELPQMKSQGTGTERPSAEASRPSGQRLDTERTEARGADCDRSRPRRACAGCRCAKGAKAQWHARSIGDVRRESFGFELVGKTCCRNGTTSFSHAPCDGRPPQAPS